MDRALIRGYGLGRHSNVSIRFDLILIMTNAVLLRLNVLMISFNKSETNIDSVHHVKFFFVYM